MCFLSCNFQDRFLLVPSALVSQAVVRHSILRNRPIASEISRKCKHILRQVCHSSGGFPDCPKIPKNAVTAFTTSDKRVVQQEDSPFLPPPSDGTTPSSHLPSSAATTAFSDSPEELPSKTGNKTTSLDLIVL